MLHVYNSICHLQALLNDILRVAEEQLDLEEGEEGSAAKKSKLSTLTLDHQRVLELFQRIAREWSEEGAEERRQSFGLLGGNTNAMRVTFIQQSLSTFLALDESELSTKACIFTIGEGVPS